MFNSSTAPVGAVSTDAMPDGFDVVAGQRAGLELAVNSLRSDMRQLLRRIEMLVDDQHQHAQATMDVDEMQRLEDADPYRWLADAKHSLQAGLMFADRALTQPTGF